MTAYPLAAWCFGARVQERIGAIEKPWVVVSDQTPTTTVGQEEPMVSNKRQKSFRATRQREFTIPGGNTLSLVAFHDGSRGFMAKNEEADALGFFDLDGERLYSNPGLMMEIRLLGEYAPGDEDGFWALVARV